MGDPQYTAVRGKKSCVCVAEWFPVFEQLAIARRLVPGPIWLIQATGTAAASAGTHSQGGAMDIGVMSHELVRLAREMGASASWVRDSGAFANNRHSHLVLDGCPHNAPARYQIAAVKAGYDGLGYQGRAGRDPEWRPSRWRTWREGLAWAREQLIPKEQREDWSDMATKEEVKAAIREVLWEPVVPGAPAGSFGAATVRQNIVSLQDRAEAALNLLRGLAARDGVDVDEGTIAAELAESLEPAIRDALAAVAPGDPDQVAARVVERLKQVRFVADEEA